MVVYGNLTIVHPQTITLELLRSFFIHSFIQDIFIGYLLNATPGIIFSIWDMLVNKTDEYPYPHKAHILVGVIKMAKCKFNCWHKKLLVCVFFLFVVET